MHKLISRAGRRYLDAGRKNILKAAPCASHQSMLYSNGVIESEEFPQEAQVVIAGGGIIGCSLAYHLAEAGVKNILLVEKGRLGCGSTWMGSGAMGRVKTTPAETELVHHSYLLYDKLNKEGHDIGWEPIGSLNLCRTKDRMTAYERSLLLAEPFGVTAEMLSDREVENRYEFLKTFDLKAGVYIPGDVCIDPMKLLNTFVNLAKLKGVKFIENCEVVHINVSSLHVTSVNTTEGGVKCDTFVNCTGQWARELGKKTDPMGVNIPVHACQASEMVSQPLPADTQGFANLPFTRDYDGFIYLKNKGGSLLGGGFPPLSKPLFHYGIPDNINFKLLPEDWDNFHVLLEQLIHRAPVLNEIKASQLRTGYEAYTPDGRAILGIVPELKNYFVAAGFNGVGTSMAGGVGKLMTEWITHGSPFSTNLWPLDVRRFVGLHNNRKFLKERVAESSCIKVGIPYWEVDMIGWDSGRRLRTSAIFTRNEPYAVFGQMMGYERPLFFHTQHGHEDKDEEKNVWTMPKPMASLHGLQTYEDSGVLKKGSYGKPLWFEQVRTEYWACREGVCIVDMTNYSKFELCSAGTEVVDFLQRVCSNDVDKPVGSVIHTGMQNENGGYENDCSLVRIQNNRYFMIAPTVQQTRSYVWMRDHLPADGSVQLTDVTSMYTALNVIGPRAPELLSELTDRSLNKKDFMFMTHKEINLAMASHVRAMRLTHTGEDGWVLYVPSEFGLHIYDALQSYGRNYGLRSAGYYALRTLRMEKFFALWGTDICNLDTPLECGREFRVKMAEGGFIGHEALLRQKQEGIRKRMVLLVLEDHNYETDNWSWGGEPIYRNGKRCGLTTSGSFSFGFEKPICYGFIQDFDEATNQPRVLSNEYLVKSAKYEVNLAGKMFSAKAYFFAPVLPSIIGKAGSRVADSH